MTLPAESSTYCRNCNFFLGDHPVNYCSHCGQETALRPTATGLMRFARDSVSHEDKIVRTLALLIVRPGELTRRYFAGKKISYVLPLKLYFATSLVFFLVVKIFGPGNLLHTKVDGEPVDPSVALAKAEGKTTTKWNFKNLSPDKDPKGEGTEVGMDAPFLNQINCSEKSIPCNKIRAYMKEKYGDSSIRAASRQVRDRVMAYAPNALFALLPVFALFTKILYWRRRMPYADHLIYALHVHTFTFILMLSIALLPVAAAEWLWLVGMIYFAVAMQRVFGGRWWVTAFRYAFIGTVYPVLLALVILLTFVAAVFI